jgi:ABC-type uncharacterized transport system substrate-binding protein
MAATAGFVGALLIGAAGSARAHPHVWVTVETTVLFERGSIAGFRHKWSFDELYATMAIQGLDANNDGTYSREELAELAKVNIEGLKDFGYFTHARLGEGRLAIGAPTDYYLEHVAPPKPATAPVPPAAATGAPAPKSSDAETDASLLGRLGSAIFGRKPPDGVAGGGEPAKVLSLHFTVPLAQPVLAEAEGFAFGVYDPSFFIAFDMAKDDAVKLGAGAPAGCRIEIGSPSKNVDDAQRLGEAFAQQLGQMNFGFAASQPIRVTCGPKS